MTDARQFKDHCNRCGEFLSSRILPYKDGAARKFCTIKCMEDEQKGKRTMTHDQILAEIKQAIDVMPHSGRKATDILRTVVDQLLHATEEKASEIATYKLTYFKKGSGKYYSEGTVNIAGLFYDAVAHVRQLQKSEKLPGLVEGHDDYDVVLYDVHGLPHLIIKPESRAKPATTAGSIDGRDKA